MKTITLFLLMTFLQGALPAEQTDLVNAERAFAKLSVERGMRESFLSFFDDTAIAFNPHPSVAKDRLRQDPPEKLPLSYTLNWTPTQGDISLAGDMGYNTGPARVDYHGPENRPPQHMVFFSVWKKRADGTWKVFLDVGVGIPEPIEELSAVFKPARTVPQNARYAWTDVEKERSALLRMDRNSTEQHLDETVRLHRPGSPPLLGKEAVEEWLATQPARKNEPIFADVATSGDMGYTYGKSERAYYARVWRRTGNGPWKIVVEVLSPRPTA